MTALLAGLDFTPLRAASFAYIDCYELIEAPAIRAIDVARTAAVPLLLNLGSSQLSPTVASALQGHPRLVVQTNVDDAAYADASPVAASLLTATSAAWVVVTAGAFGATALSEARKGGCLRCERGHDEPLPTLAELEASVRLRERVSPPNQPPRTAPTA